LEINNFTTRALSGAVFVAILVSGIIIGYETFLTLMLIIIGLTLNEFYVNVKKGGLAPNFSLGLIAGLGTFISFFIFAFGGYQDVVFLAFPLLIYIGIFISELFRNKPNPFMNVAITLLGVFYIALPFAILNFLVFLQFSNLDGVIFDWYYILALFILVWTNDTFAYLTGMAIGKHKFFERISPKKTWEGIIGGIVFTILMGIGLYKLYPDIAPLGKLGFSGLTMIEWVGLALVVSIFADLGDLVESMLKRSLGIKDSGSIIPGHGGMLDRFDAILLAAPAAFVYMMFIIV
jgi:phosphatidate cytidylyltransferase